MKTEMIPMSPQYDPWEAMTSRLKSGQNIVTSVEFTVTNLCNLRCQHCAVGDVLTMKDPTEKVPLPVILQRLDEIETLETLSITGGEPMYSKKIIEDYIVPILRYAHERGVRTQINSNLTLELERYDAILPYLDVLHISYNYLNAEDFYKIAYVHTSHPVSFAQGEKTFERMVENTIQLAKQGVFVSAESLISEYTKDKLPAIHHQIKDMGCKRHEVHPLYPSDFAKDMKVLSLSELREVYNRLLDERDPELWILFGTLPYYACSSNEQDLQLIKRIHSTPNTTARNDPDGHNRLNVSIFTGEVTVTDFGDVGPLGNIHSDRLDACFKRWQEHPMFQPFNCYCPESHCVGPNILVAHTYYPSEDFRHKKGIKL